MRTKPKSRRVEEKKENGLKTEVEEVWEDLQHWEEKVDRLIEEVDELLTKV